jgi:hypothetical protein
VEVLAAQRGKLAAAISARKAADEATTEILAGAASCDAIDDADKKAACTAEKPKLDRKLAEADQNAKDEQALYDAMLKSANGGTPMQVGAQAAVTSFMGSHTVSDAAVKDIASAVVEIVKNNFAANSTCERAREALANGKMTAQAFSNACSSAFSKPQALTGVEKSMSTKIQKSGISRALDLFANVYVQYANISQRERISALLDALNTKKTGNGSFIGPEFLPTAPNFSEVRCYDAVGCNTASELIKLLGTYLKTPVVLNTMSNEPTAKPTQGTIELWISRNEDITLPN